eukprot:4762671-Alexandrium_andersonii.AAC.1
MPCPVGDDSANVTFGEPVGSQRSEQGEPRGRRPHHFSHVCPSKSTGRTSSLPMRECPDASVSLKARVCGQSWRVGRGTFQTWERGADKVVRGERHALQFGPHLEDCMHVLKL